MRVLTVGNMYPPQHHGGYELVWQSAVEHLRSRGHDVRVLTTDHDEGVADPDPAYVSRALRWHWVPGGFEDSRRFRVARHNHQVLREQIADLRPDVVSWWSMGGLTMTLLEDVRRRGIPAVAFVHDDWLLYGPKVDPWLRLFTGPRRSRFARLGERIAGIPTRVDLSRAADYVFVSEFTRDRSGIPSDRTDVANSGIHTAFLNPAEPGDWAWRLLYVGRLDERKGVATAVEALHKVPQAVLTVAGGGDDRERQRLTELAAPRGDRVVFAGQLDRPGLIAAYEATDAVVFPVRWDEPWGLVPLEAMAKGRPVVATGRGGSGEYLRDGDNCLLFPAGNADALAAAVHRLAGDPKLRERLRDEGVRTASGHLATGFDAAVERSLLAATGESVPHAAAVP